MCDATSASNSKTAPVEILASASEYGKVMSDW